MKRLTRMSAIFLFAGLSSCSSVNSVAPLDQQQIANLLDENSVSFHAKEKIAFDLPQPSYWQKLDLSSNHRGTPVAYIPRHENLGNWSERINTYIGSYALQPNLTLAQTIQMIAKRASNHCEHADTETFDETKSSMMYRINMTNCEQHENQVEIGKAMKGTDAIYILRYTAVMSRVSSKRVDEMHAVIQNAKLAK